MAWNIGFSYDRRRPGKERTRDLRDIEAHNRSEVLERECGKEWKVKDRGGRFVKLKRRRKRIM